MKISGQGIVCAGTLDSPRAVATFPSVAVLSDGTLLAAYRIGPSKDSNGSITELRRSTDNGCTWTAPETPFSSVFAGIEGSLQVVYITRLSDAQLIACALWVDREAFPDAPLFHPETEGCLPMRVLVADSHDQGRTWSPWREVPVTPDIGPPSLTNPIVRLRSGRLIVSIETNKPYLDRSPWFQHVVYCESTDHGQTWTLPRTVCQDPTGAIFHWDQRLAVAPNNTLAAFSWTYDRVNNCYLPIRRHISHDEGQTWSDDTLDFADQPSHPAVLRDGRAVLAWVDRYGTRSIRARCASALDAAFDPTSEIVLYQAESPARETADTAGMLTDMGLWSFGLPYAEALPNGDVFIVYYAGTPQSMDVRWVRLQLQ